MSNKHEAALPDGKIAKRVSKSRTYPYCVAVRLSYEHALMQALQLRDVDRSNFAYYQAKLDGTSQWGKPRHGESAEAFQYRWDKEVAEAKVELAGVTDAGAYQKVLIARRRADVEARKAEGYYDKWGVAGWCGRRDLAQKLAGTCAASPYYAEAKIIETVIK